MPDDKFRMFVINSISVALEINLGFFLIKDDWALNRSVQRVVDDPLIEAGQKCRSGERVRDVAVNEADREASTFLFDGIRG